MAEIELAEHTRIAIRSTSASVCAEASPLDFFYISTPPFMATQRRVTNARLSARRI